MQSIVNQTERRISPTRRAVATIVTLVTGTCMNSSATKSTPIHVLALYDSTRAWSGAKSHSKKDRKNFLGIRRRTSNLQDGCPHLHLRQLPQRSLRHLRHQLSLPNPLFTSRRGATSRGTRVRTVLQKSSC